MAIMVKRAVKKIWAKNWIFHVNKVAGLQEYSLFKKARRREEAILPPISAYQSLERIANLRVLFQTKNETLFKNAELMATIGLQFPSPNDLLGACRGLVILKAHN
jgi:hypothetical protein